MKNSLLGTEDCSKYEEELSGTATLLFQPCGDRGGQGVRRPGGRL